LAECHRLQLEMVREGSAALRETRGVTRLKVALGTAVLLPLVGVAAAGVAVNRTLVALTPDARFGPDAPPA
jgi:hypothetical protein